MWPEQSYPSLPSLHQLHRSRITRAAAQVRLVAILGVLLMSTLTACAVPFSGGVPPKVSLIATSRPFAVILCKAQDDTSEPHPLAFYQKLFTDATAGLGNVYNYFTDQSYGMIDLAGTTVVDWAPTSLKTADLRTMGRGALAQACADTAKGKVIWATFRTGGLPNGVITLWNVNGLDSGQGGGLVAEDGLSFPLVNAGTSPALGGADSTTVSFYTHEMLHAFGLAHSHGPYLAGDPVAPAKEELDLSDTHTFGALKWQEYGDCWSIMGCGYWIQADDPYGVAGPDLGAAQRDELRWMPKARIVTYDRSSTTTVTLAPANAPAIKGSLLIKIPLDSGGYYTIEYAAKLGWSKNIPLDHAVLIHEVPTVHSGESFLVGRTPFGTWFPGQVFRDPVNHVRVSIGSFGDTATITLSPDGTGDGGAYTCAPPGYISAPGIAGWSPSVSVLFTLPPPGTAYYAGVPATFVAKTFDPVIAPSPVPEDHILWAVNGAAAGTGSSLTHTFASAGDYTLSVQVLGRSCYSASQSVPIHVVTGSPPPPTPTPRPGGSAKLSVSPMQTTGYCLNGQYPSLSVANIGTASLQWSASGPQEVTITPPSGTLAPNQQPQAVTLSGLYPGHATLIINFASNGGNQSVTITCQ